MDNLLCIWWKPCAAMYKYLYRTCILRRLQRHQCKVNLWKCTRAMLPLLLLSFDILCKTKCHWKSLESKAAVSVSSKMWSTQKLKAFRRRHHHLYCKGRMLATLGHISCQAGMRQTGKNSDSAILQISLQSGSGDEYKTIEKHSGFHTPKTIMHLKDIPFSSSIFFPAV